MEFRADKAFFKSDTTDSLTKLPIYVFDSTYLPNLAQSSYDKSTQDQLILKCFKRIVKRIPKHPYILICFTSGFKNLGNQMNSWVTMLKCYQLLPSEFRTNLKKIYMVHESWLVRSLAQILNNVLNLKLFKPNSEDAGSHDKIVYCSTLTEMSKVIDITKIRISLDVYLFDLQFNDKLIIPYTVKQKSKDYIDYKNLILDRTMSRLLIEAKNFELVLTKPGNPKKLGILIDAIDRMNYIDLSQWDIYSVGSLLLNIIRNHDVTLIPIDLIKLPLKNSIEYTLEIFNDITESNDSYDLISKIMELLVTLLNNNKNTKHDLKSLPKTVAPSLCQEKVSMKNNDRLTIGQAYIKNLLENWDEINKLSLKNNTSLGATILSQPATAPSPPSPRKVSFTKQPIIMPKREARALPDTPATNSSRNTSESSIISIDSKSSTESSIDINDTALQPTAPLQNHPIEPQKSFQTDSGVKVLSDVTSSLNKVVPEKFLMKSPQKPITKFSDGYSSIQGKKKVNKLAQLYEERLKGLEILNQIETRDT